MYFSGKSLLGASKLFQPCYMDINIYIRFFFCFVYFEHCVCAV